MSEGQDLPQSGNEATPTPEGNRLEPLPNAAVRDVLAIFGNTVQACRCEKFRHPHDPAEHHPDPDYGFYAASVPEMPPFPKLEGESASPVGEGWRGRLKAIDEAAIAATVWSIQVFKEDDGRFAASYESGDGTSAGMGSYAATPVGALAELCALLIKVAEDESKEPR